MKRVRRWVVAGCLLGFAATVATCKSESAVLNNSGAFYIAGIAIVLLSIAFYNLRGIR